MWNRSRTRDGPNASIVRLVYPEVSNGKGQRICVQYFKQRNGKIFKELIEKVIPKKKRKTEVKSSNNCHYKGKN